MHCLHREANGALISGQHIQCHFHVWEEEMDDDDRM